MAGLLCDGIGDPRERGLAKCVATQHGGVVDEHLANQMASANRRRAGLGRRASDPLRDSPAMIRRVYSYVAYRIGDGQDAEDVTGDVFERALRYRDTFDPARGSPTGWVLGIARRAVAEHLGRPAVARRARCGRSFYRGDR
jgi:DNA-directed RNA polymerase specialized sigma24 family protein